MWINIMNLPTAYIVPTGEMGLRVKTIPPIDGYWRTGFRLGRDHVYGVCDSLDGQTDFRHRRNYVFSAHGKTNFSLGRDHVYGVRDLSFPIPRERYILPNGEEAINRGRRKRGPYPWQLVEQQGYDREDGTGSIGRRGRDD